MPCFAWHPVHSERSKFWDNKKTPTILAGVLVTSNYLISQAVSSQVPSVYICLTTVLGMRKQVTPLLVFPKNFTEERLRIRINLLVRYLHSLLIRTLELRSPNLEYKSSPRPISTSQLHGLLHFHIWPIYLVIYKGPYFFRMTDLILRLVSRLDAFSVYPFRT